MQRQRAITCLVRKVDLRLASPLLKAMMPQKKKSTLTSHLSINHLKKLRHLVKTMKRRAVSLRKDHLRQRPQKTRRERTYLQPNCLRLLLS